MDQWLEPVSRRSARPWIVAPSVYGPVFGSAGRRKRRSAAPDARTGSPVAAADPFHEVAPELIRPRFHCRSTWKYSCSTSAGRRKTRSPGRAARSFAPRRGPRAPVQPRVPGMLDHLDIVDRVTEELAQRRAQARRHAVPVRMRLRAESSVRDRSAGRPAPRVGRCLCAGQCVSSSRRGGRSRSPERQRLARHVRSGACVRAFARSAKASRRQSAKTAGSGSISRQETAQIQSVPA